MDLYVYLQFYSLISDSTFYVSIMLFQKFDLEIYSIVLHLR